MVYPSNSRMNLKSCQLRYRVTLQLTKVIVFFLIFRVSIPFFEPNSCSVYKKKHLANRFFAGIC